jgi:hypothetical protein
VSTPAIDRASTVRQLDQELELIQGAVRLVAGGRVTRVRLGALTFGEPLLQRARSLASQAGVQLTPEWTASDGGGIGLIVERGGDAGA